MPTSAAWGGQTLTTRSHHALNAGRSGRLSRRFIIKTVLVFKAVYYIYSSAAGRALMWSSENNL